MFVRRLISLKKGEEGTETLSPKRPSASTSSKWVSTSETVVYLKYIVIKTKKRFLRRLCGPSNIFRSVHQNDSNNTLQIPPFRV